MKKEAKRKAQRKETKVKKTKILNPRPNMTSVAPSDTESNVSGFIRYSDKNFKYLYTSMIENMELINQDILKIEKNLKNIVDQSGPLESHLSVLLQTLPKPQATLPMETD